ncbi:condensation domain-containing protein [Streptomyces sp. NPDC050287]|uniref:condensation domain-containing protein n=1 Tax=Streptomyces sp. NPDC050287 TaxID=3365608 RepID=UPI0037AD27C3
MTQEEHSARMANLSPAKRALLEQWLTTQGRDVRAVSQAPPVTATERLLLKIWRDVLRIEEIGVEDDFFSLGGDSITSLQIAVRAAEAGLSISSRQVLEAETVSRLAELARPMERAVEDVATGRVPLTPIQRWFFEQELPHAERWDQTIRLVASAALDADVLRSALASLVGHHDILRARFAPEEETWGQSVPVDTSVPVPLRVVDLSRADGPAYEDAMAAAVRAVEADIDLGRGPLLSAVLFQFGPTRQDMVLLAFHHLVVDGISLRVLVEDLDRAYRRLARGQSVDLPALTTSFRSWSQLLRRFAGQPEVRSQLAYWRDVPCAGAARLPVDHEDGPNTVGSTGTVFTRADSRIGRALLFEVPRSSRVPVQHVLLACLLLTWWRCHGTTALQIDLEGHGRESIDSAVDVSRTVGWFTTIFPVVLRAPDTPEAGDLTAALNAVRKVMTELPMAGLGYGLLRYLSPGGDNGMGDLPQSQLSFNYLGRFEPLTAEDAVLGIPLQMPGLLQDPSGPRRYVVEVAVSAVEDRLLVAWTYSRSRHQRETVQRLADAYMSALEDAVRLLARQEAGDVRHGVAP